MAYVSIPKDLNAVKTKFVMGLTKRQFICFGIAVILGLPLFFLVKTVAPVAAAAMLMLIVMLPFFLFAMYEKNGLPLEKYLKLVISVKFSRPMIRTYQTNNLYYAAGRQTQLYKEVQTIVSENKNRRGV